MTSDDFGLIFAGILWAFGAFRLSKFAYLVWFDYYRFVKESRPHWYGPPPEQHYSAVAELLNKIILPIFWLIWMGVPVLIIRSVIQGN